MLERRSTFPQYIKESLANKKAQESCPEAARQPRRLHLKRGAPQTVASRFAALQDGQKACNSATTLREPETEPSAVHRSCQSGWGFPVRPSPVDHRAGKQSPPPSIFTHLDGHIGGQCPEVRVRNEPWDVPNTSAEWFASLPCEPSWSLLRDRLQKCQCHLWPCTRPSLPTELDNGYQPRTLPQNPAAQHLPPASAHQRLGPAL